SLYWMLLGVTLAILGMQSVYFGCLAQVLNDLRGDARRRWTDFFRYTRSMGWSAVAFLFGIGSTIPLVREYMRNGLNLPHEVTRETHLGVAGLFFIIAAFMNFAFTLVLHASNKK